MDAAQSRKSGVYPLNDLYEFVRKTHFELNHALNGVMVERATRMLSVVCQSHSGTRL